MSAGAAQPRVWHFAWRGARQRGGRMGWERIAGIADAYGFEVIERRDGDPFATTGSRFWIRDRDCPDCGGTRWAEIDERPACLDYVHPYDIANQAVPPAAAHRTLELLDRVAAGAPDPFAGLAPAPSAGGRYLILRDGRRLGVASDLRGAIGLATARHADQMVEERGPDAVVRVPAEPCPACGGPRWLPVPARDVALRPDSGDDVPLEPQGEQW